MTAAIFWSLGRSLLVAGLAVWLGRRIATLLEPSPSHAVRRRRTVAWAAILATILMPSLAVGYAYRLPAMRWVNDPLKVEALYFAVMLAQSVPLAAVILHFSPPPAVSRSGLHAFRLLRKERSIQTARQLAALYWHGPIGRVLPAAAIAFLLVFQETEIASLMQARGWPEYIFTQHAGGLPLAESFRLTTWPLIIELTVMGPVAQYLLRVGRQEQTFENTESQAPGFLVAGWMILLLALAIVFAYPGAVMLRGLPEGLPVLARQPALPREIMNGLVLAAIAGTAAAFASQWVTSGSGGSYRPDDWRFNIRGGLRWMPLALGLSGGLVLSLTLARLFQSQWLHWAYSSPIGVIIALTLLLLPRAVLLFGLLGPGRRSSAIATAELLASSSDATQRQHASDLLWKLRWQPQFTATLILCYWAYFELTITSQLAPPGLATAPLRLYNFMHYGRIAGLSAMLAVTVAVPVVLAAIAWFSFRRWGRWFLRRRAV